MTGLYKMPALTLAQTDENPFLFLSRIWSRVSEYRISTCSLSSLQKCASIAGQYLACLLCPRGVGEPLRKVLSIHAAHLSSIYSPRVSRRSVRVCRVMRRIPKAGRFLRQCDASFGNLFSIEPA